MNLADTLFNFEKYLDLVPDSLAPYAAQDTVGGYHPDASQAKWGAGAIWDVEGRILYALIRALKPETLLEIGGGTGCSTTHIASALLDNGSGHLTTLDRGNTPQVPSDLQDLVDIRNDDAINYLALVPDHSLDFILEDADHSEALCAAIGDLAKSKLKPGGVLLFHDAAHFGVGHDVCAGFDRAGLDFRVYLTEPSDCGWGVWRAPKVDYSPFTTIKDVESAVDILTDALHDDESTADKLADFTVLQAQEEPNMHSEYVNATAKFQVDMLVKVIDPKSKYYEQIGRVYSNYRSGAEPQAYGIHFDDGNEFWVRETDLDAAPAPVKRTTRKPKKVAK